MPRDLEDRRKEFTEGSEKVLNSLCKLLPPGMQGLKFLFNAKQYDRIGKYLEQIFIDRKDADPVAYEQILNNLAAEVEQISIKDATIYFADNIEFNKRTEPEKEVLIKQQALIYRMQFDLKYATDIDSTIIEAVRTLLVALNNNIHSFLDPHIKHDFRTMVSFFDRGVAQITKHMDSLTSNTPFESETIKFGSGLGLSWKPKAPRARPASA